MSDPSLSSSLGPVSASERIELLDVLRGFALIGVLYVNMHNFGSWEVTGPTHTAAAFLVEAFFNRRFFSLFSLLFGMGFALQMLRAEQRNQSIFRVYSRRLMVLFGLGWAHALIYPGDIVRLYAVLGFVLFLFRRWSPRRLVTLALIIFTAEWAWFVIGTGIPELSEATAVAEEVQDNPQTELRGASSDPVEEQAAARVRVFREGSLSEVVMANLFWQDRWIGILRSYGPAALGLFLMGMGILRSGVVENVARHRRAIRRFMWWMLGLGFPMIISSAYFTVGDPEPSVLLLLGSIVYAVGNPALALAYASFIALQFSQPKWHRLLHPLAAVGRVPLSAYVGQSVVYTTIYHGYGLGLWGRLGPAHILPLAALIFGLEIIVCNWWVRRFRFGPLEWLWRSATYLKWQPMRVSPGV